MHLVGFVKLEFHDPDTDTDILSPTRPTRDFLQLSLWQAERHADILATILARMSARKSVSVSVSWNASFTDLISSRGRVIASIRPFPLSFLNRVTSDFYFMRAVKVMVRGQG